MTVYSLNWKFKGMMIENDDLIYFFLNIATSIL